MLRTLLLCIVCATLLSCQNSSVLKQKQIDSIRYTKKAIQFIKEVKSKELSNNDLLLEDRPSSAGIDCIVLELSKDSIFSKQDLNLILKEFKQPLIHRWTSEMFPTIRITPSDTIHAIFQDPTKGWNYIYNHLGSSINSFAPPVFLKNNSYCLFYSDFSCGLLCGQGYLGLYRNNGEKWVEVKTYCGWIS